MSSQQVHCWCGARPARPIGPDYRECPQCGTIVAVVLPRGQDETLVADREFYGEQYWLDYQRARGFPDIYHRARADLSERCVFWLAHLLKVMRSPGRIVEMGCGHGGFVRLLKELGFDALGIELSPWIADFARRTFDVDVVSEPLEKVDLRPGLRGVVSFDVLEHLRQPLDTMRRCADLLLPDGILMLQTPCYRGEGPDWSMFQEHEHIFLFTDSSIRALLEQAGFRAIQVEPSLFPYDMLVVASRGEITRYEEELALPAVFQAVLDLYAQLRATQESLRESETDRAARFEQIEELTRLLHESEEDREARFHQIQELTRLLKQSEAL